jgi:hypothetical protein
MSKERSEITAEAVTEKRKSILYHGLTIKTAFHGPTNYRGARITASALASLSDEKEKRVSLSYDHGLEGTENHLKAALTLAAKMAAEDERGDICGWGKFLTDRIEAIESEDKRGNVFFLRFEGKE